MTTAKGLRSRTHFTPNPIFFDSTSSSSSHPILFIRPSPLHPTQSTSPRASDRWDTTDNQPSTNTKPKMTFKTTEMKTQITIPWKAEELAVYLIRLEPQPR